MQLIANMSSIYSPQPNYITWHAVTKIINCWDTEGENDIYDTVLTVHLWKLFSHNSGVWMEEYADPEIQCGDAHLLTLGANENLPIM
jgi:hypothetical protein